MADDTDATIQWLHLSDLHARLRDDWDAGEVTRSLVADLKSLASAGLRPDFIFFTGDCAFGATGKELMSDQYQRAKQFFEAVRTAFTPEVPLRHLYLVPGNHDIDRGEITQGETQWLRNPHRSTEEIVAAMRDNTKQWRTWMSRLANYRHFLTSYGLLHLSPDEPQLIWTDERQFGTWRVGIAGLNSAWSCADDDDKGKLWCGVDWQIARIKQRLGPVDFSFALIHHPGNWLNDREDPSGMRRLKQEFQVVLHGHEHQDWIERDLKQHIVLSAGACYQCSWMPNGYSFGSIDLSTLKAQVWFRQWDSTGRGWVAREIAHTTRGGGVCDLGVLPWLSPHNATQAPRTPPITRRKTRDDGLSGAHERTHEHFTARYCQHVIDKNDVLELFGCDIPRELQRHQLSVAYVSLHFIRDDDDENDENPGAQDGPLPSADSNGTLDDKSNDTSTVGASQGIERTLDDVTIDTQRLMILGPAGAGKSTLLRWCALTAARSVSDPDKAPTEQRPSWRQKVPFLIRLRDISNGRLPAAEEIPRFVAKHLPSPPAGWITDILSAGAGLILFDGVDEVHREQRSVLADEIADFVRAYPLCTYIITTRPGAVDDSWLGRLDFVEAHLTPMGRTDREEFIDKWYRSAALELQHRPRVGEDLAVTAAQLKIELVDQPELGVLASNPLLCAMICALYRERQERLPETPAELCEALVQMLLHRRERETPGLQDAHFSATWRALQYSQKKGLIAELAWHMVRHDDSNIERAAAVAIAGDVLASTPGRRREEADEVVQGLIERSGVLRPSGHDQIDFLHNSLKEYLAAGPLLDSADPSNAAQHASDPTWQPVILFALAIGPEPFSSGLVRQVLAQTPGGSQAVVEDRADRAALARAHAQRFFLIRCRSASKRLAADLSTSIDRLTSRLLPPPYMADVSALALVGPRLLTLERAARFWDEKWWAERDVRTALRSLRLLRLIGGPRAAQAASSIRRLQSFSSSLTGEWIMASSELGYGEWPWPFRGRAQVDIANTRVSDLTPLRQLANTLISVDAARTRVRDLQPLAEARHLESLDFEATRVEDLSPLTSCESLKVLNVSRTNVADLVAVRRIRGLSKLFINYTKVSSLEPLSDLIYLRTLLCDGTVVGDLSPLRSLRHLSRLDIDSTPITDLSPLADLKLQALWAQRLQVLDWGVLSHLPTLTTLHVAGSNIDSLEYVSKSRVLARVGLSRGQLKHLPSLVSLKALKHLTVTSDCVNSEELAKFSESRPDVRVQVP